MDGHQCWAWARKVMVSQEIKTDCRQIIRITGGKVISIQPDLRSRRMNGFFLLGSLIFLGLEVDKNQMLAVEPQGRGRAADQELSPGYLSPGT